MFNPQGEKYFSDEEIFKQTSTEPKGCQLNPWSDVDLNPYCKERTFWGTRSRNLQDDFAINSKETTLSATFAIMQLATSTAAMSF